MLSSVLRSQRAVKVNIEIISALVLDRHRLRDALAEKIEHYRQVEHKAAFKELLSAGLVVSEEKALDFSKIIYDPSSWYEGGCEFKNHCLPIG